MNKKLVDKISHHVTDKFPEMRGVRPNVSRQAGSSEEDPHYQLTFKGNAELPGGRRLKRIVRVIVDQDGRILRMSTSR